MVPIHLNEVIITQNDEETNLHHKIVELYLKLALIENDSVIFDFDQLNKMDSFKVLEHIETIVNELKTSLANLNINKSENNEKTFGDKF